jgi:Fanconi-associated nuclease 1
VHGIRIEREIPIKPATKVNGESTVRKVGPTIWVDEREDNAECRVEEMCLSWYRDNGWKGYHSEGGIVRTLVRKPFPAYLLFDSPG